MNEKTENLQKGSILKVITEEQLAYYERALAFALRHGFKATIFGDDGKIIGYQG